MPIITILQFALIAGVVVYLTVNMWHLVKVAPSAEPLSPPPFVSVCVPARNEARGIEACLTSLLKQDYPRFEVIAVDDNSTDATLEIMQSLAGAFANLKVIRGAPLPTGWYGKPFALHQASAMAGGDYLLFTDADPVFRPQAIASAMRYMQNNDLDVLTLMPGTQLLTFWEKAVQPVIFAFIAGLTRFKKVNSKEYPNAMGIGAFILIKREVYEAIGGHERVRQKIVEDIELAKCAKRGGYRLVIADGKAILSIRMYHSLREIWTGWRKNMFVALKKSVFWTLYYITVILGFQVTPYVVLSANLWTGSSVPSIALASFGVMLVLITGARLCGELQIPARLALLFPLGALVMAAIMLNSMVQSLLKGQTEWRGRKV
ncbi:MAG: glycosyltransferase [Nitrospinales bacterium]